MQSPTFLGSRAGAQALGRAYCSRAVGQRALKVDRAPAMCAGGSGFWKDIEANDFSEDGWLFKLEVHCAPMYAIGQQELGPT